MSKGYKKKSGITIVAEKLVSEQRNRLAHSLAIGNAKWFVAGHQ